MNAVEFGSGTPSVHEYPKGMQIGPRPVWLDDGLSAGGTIIADDQWFLSFEKNTEHAVKFSSVLVDAFADREHHTVEEPFLELFRLAGFEENERTACLKALDIMKRSKDPFHSAMHPSRMASDFLKFVNRFPMILEQQQIKAVVIAISTHDLARSLQPPSFLGAVDGYFNEKKHAAPVAKKFLLRNGFDEERDKKLLDDVLTAVHEHTLADTFDRKSKVSQWLYGLDCLDLVSKGRLQEMGIFLKALSEYKVFKVAMRMVQKSLLSIAQDFTLYEHHFAQEYGRRLRPAKQVINTMHVEFELLGSIPFPTI